MLWTIKHVLGWTKMLFLKSYRQNLNELFGQPNITELFLLYTWNQRIIVN